MENIISLSQPTQFCKNAHRTNLVRRQYSNAVGGGSSANSSDKYRKVVGYWLLGCSGMVFVAVALGGIVYYSICRVLETGLEKPSRK